MQHRLSWIRTARRRFLTCVCGDDHPCSSWRSAERARVIQSLIDWRNQYRPDISLATWLPGDVQHQEMTCWVRGRDKQGVRHDIYFLLEL